MRVRVRVGVQQCFKWGFLVRRRPTRAFARFWSSRMLDATTRRVISAHQMRAVLHHQLMPANALRLYHAGPDACEYYSLVDLGGGGSMFTRRILHPDRSEVLHDLMTKEPEAAPPRGMSVLLTRNCVALYELIGVRRVLMTAGLSSGSSLWPKLGFKPATRAGMASVLAHVEARIDQLPPIMRPSTRSKLKAIMMPGQGGGSERQHLPGLIFLISGLPGKVEFRQGASTKEENIGDFLLKGARWEGVLDLDDPASRRQLNTYIGVRRNYWLPNEIILSSIAETVANFRREFAQSVVE